jgi:6-phosphogluconolactonase
MHRRIGRITAVTAFALALVALPGAASGEVAAGQAHPGAIYTLSNQPNGNAVLVFAREEDGSIALTDSVPTGGAGTGAGLGSQGALILSHGRLFGVDAGSNEISAFDVSDDGLNLTHLDTVSSGGVLPVSVTVHRNLLYVVNAGDAAHPGNIVGFRVQAGGLAPIPGSERPLSAPVVGPAQISFADRGRLLIVTEKDTNLIDTYEVASDGTASGPTTHPSAGITPFGFEVRRNLLVVSEAFGGAPDASATSSYRVASGGSLDVISASVETTETAACWVVITSRGNFAYVTNTGSDTISGYRIASNGSLWLLDPDGVTATTGDAPIDMTLAMGDRYLYALNSLVPSISAFEVHPDGSLSAMPGASGLPAGAAGLAGR